jgi:hypothetical protein
MFILKDFRQSKIATSGGFFPRHFFREDFLVSMLTRLALPQRAVKSKRPCGAIEVIE